MLVLTAGIAVLGLVQALVLPATASRASMTSPYPGAADARGSPLARASPPAPAAG